jgi:hypothetical protein
MIKLGGALHSRQTDGGQARLSFAQETKFMETTKTYEIYPLGTVIQSNLVSLGIYILGFLIILKLGLVFSLLYLLYILALEFRLIRDHCTICYYWGKTCGFGKGWLSALFFNKGDTSKFCAHPMTWRDMIPDILISLIPFIVGILLLFLEFDFMLLSAILFLVILTTSGNGYIRGTLTCRFCQQREIGCPADMLFNKAK